MGLIAREIESRGIPTLSLTSAWSITASVSAPRAVFVDYPLGHTAGKVDDREDQRAILRAALAAFETIDTPGTILPLAHRWGVDDAWKDPVTPEAGAANDVAATEDDRGARLDQPQYQSDDDAAAAKAPCAGCVFLEDNRP